MIRKLNTSIKSVFVLGSSSEIAQEICIQLANNGCESFHLLARNLEKNTQLVKILKDKKIKNIIQENFDLLKDQETMKEVAQYDLYLITAGFLGSSDFASINISELIMNQDYGSLVQLLEI